METTKKAVGFRVTPGAVRALAWLSQEMGVSQNAVIEMAVREMAKSRGFDPGAADQHDGRRAEQSGRSTGNLGA